ncbi:MAG: hypothetical protein ACQER7_12165 [Bacteroidota bacterium]
MHKFKVINGSNEIPGPCSEDHIQGVFINGCYRQLENRALFRMLANVIGGITLAEAEEMGLLDPEKKPE